MEAVSSMVWIFSGITQWPIKSKQFPAQINYFKEKINTGQFWASWAQFLERPLSLTLRVTQLQGICV